MLKYYSKTIKIRQTCNNYYNIVQFFNSVTYILACVIDIVLFNIYSNFYNILLRRKIDKFLTIDFKLIYKNILHESNI